MNFAVFGILFLIIGAGQQIQQAPFVGNAQTTTTPAPAPLKCGKGQHWEGKHLSCHGQYPIICDGVIPAHCEDDSPLKLHTVTEKDWAELMERLKRLEGKEKAVFGPFTTMSGPKEGRQ